MRSEQGKSTKSIATIASLSISIVICSILVLWPYHKKYPEDSDVLTVAFSTDSKKILGGTREGIAYLWNIETGQLLGFGCVSKSAMDRTSAPFNSLALAPGGQFVVVAGSRLSLLLIGSSNRLAPNIWVPDLAFGGAAVSPDGSNISAVSSGEQLLLWEVGRSPRPRELGPADAGVYGATAFSSDGKRVISAGHTLRMLDVQTGQELWRGPRDSYAFHSVAFRADGDAIVTGSQDTNIRLWNAKTGNEIEHLKGHRSYVDAVAFDRSGNKIASWARDGQLFLWNLSVATPDYRVLGVTTGGAAFSPDGRWIASGGPSKSVLFWDATTNAKARVLSVDTKAQFSTDGSACKFD